MNTPQPAQVDAAAPGSVKPDCSAASDALIIAFVQGAQWWEYHRTGATMWQSDRNMAEARAEERLSAGTLGKLPNTQAQRPAQEDQR